MMKQRIDLKIQGIVQGVGFRPFVYQLATELGLTGWVKNSAEGVSIALEGDRTLLETFLLRLQSEKPSLALIQNLETFWGDVVGYDRFEIKTSTGGEKTALILPDIATCPECLEDIFDPKNRRYRYPFTNCTNCGSRFSIIETLPYDRPNTTMKQFEMCDCCLAEYQNPLNRRFHAQPNACPECGPRLELWDRQGEILATDDKALLATAEAIRQGKIIALKGLGGFHLVVDAGNEAAVRQLRDRKHRPDKPLALMYPSLELVQAHCQVSALEAKILSSPQAPIVILKVILKIILKSDRRATDKPKTPPFSLSPSIAPNNPYLGIMLPYTPLHHLLTRELNFPIVATSGNLSGEPICIDNREALERLNNIADLFLVHNRPIARPVDDSIVRVIAGREQILRRARGYAPLPITRGKNLTSRSPILAVGGQLKNAIAFLQGDRLFLSQYIGDLETSDTYQRFQQTIADFQQLYDLNPAKISCDLHPHYLSSQYARKLDTNKTNLSSKNLTDNCGLKRSELTAVQHHYAHVLSCLVDNGLNLTEPVLGVAWDGTGYGADGTIWGGEFLKLTSRGFERVAHLATFRLPGGDRAIQEPRRIAVALLYEIFGDRLFTQIEQFNYLPWIETFTSQELNILRTMLKKKINAPITSSMGRLFDAIASILGICQQIGYEGQAAMQLEFAIGDLITDAAYHPKIVQPVDATTNSSLLIDWKTIIVEILRDLAKQRSVAEISAKFHNTLVEIIVAVAKQVQQKQIVLTGGCWQNKYLTEKTITRLKAENLIPYWHHHLPCNDSGIAVGQILAALRTPT